MLGDVVEVVCHRRAFSEVQSATIAKSLVRCGMCYRSRCGDFAARNSTRL